MATEQKDYSTYTRILITLSSFGDLFIRGEKTPSMMGLPTNIITNKEINWVLDDPLNKEIKTLMRAEAGKVELDRTISSLKDEVDEQKIFIEESLNKLAQKKDPSPAEKETIKSAKQTLENQYRKLNGINDTLKNNYQQLNNLAQRIAKMKEGQKKEREDFRRTTLQDIGTEFDKLKLKGEKLLNEYEMNQLQRVDSWPDIIKSFQEAKIEWPKHIDRKNPSYSAYFELKSYLAIRSALSRNFLPHDYNHVMEHMKNEKLSGEFKKAEEKSASMYDQQEGISKEMLKNDVEPVLSSLKNNLNSLEQMKSERESLLKVVAPTQIEAIQQSTRTRMATIEPKKPGF